MTGSTLQSKDVNVLQAINLTLSTGVFLALADKLPELFRVEADAILVRFLYAALIVFWAVKLLAENHRSFGGERIRVHPRYAIFQLLMTVVMFTTLIAAARTVNDLPESAIWLFAAMVGGLVWLSGLATFFQFWNPVAGEKFDLHKFEWWWAGSALVSAAGAFVMHLNKMRYDSCPVQVAVTTAIMIIVLAADAWRTKTFDVSR